MICGGSFGIVSKGGLRGRGLMVHGNHALDAKRTSSHVEIELDTKPRSRESGGTATIAER